MTVSDWNSDSRSQLSLRVFHGNSHASKKCPYSHNLPLSLDVDWQYTCKNYLYLQAALSQLLQQTINGKSNHGQQLVHY
jgi:hypothetical protein